MNYTINKLSKLAGISTRTLRYYDELSLLKPNKINESGYRIYTSHEVDTLQQILFYKSLGVALADIKKIITAKDFDTQKALENHYSKLLEKRKSLDMLIKTVERTIKANGGKEIMTDQEKFEGFKENLIDKNEQKYGKEIREKYGDKTVNESITKLKKMNKNEFDHVEQLANQVNEAIKSAFELGNPTSELAMTACELHKEWIMNYWPTYSKEAHMGLVNMYVEDERFKKYYEKIAPGCTEFLRDAMVIFTSK